MNVKTGVKTKFLLHDILTKLALEMYASDIAKKYGWPRQKINYYVKKLKLMGLIKEKYRSTYKIYELTPECKKFITECNMLKSGIRLHNLSFKYPIIKAGSMAYDKEISILGYWKKQLKRINNCTVEKTPENMILHLGSLVGSDPYELLNKARSQAEDIANILKKEFGFELGDPVMIKRPHYAIQDPIAQQVVKHIQVTTDQAKLDQSEGLGELEYFDPESVNNYIKMPSRLEALEDHLVKQTEIMDKFSKNLELHLAVLNEIKEAIKRLGK